MGHDGERRQTYSVAEIDGIKIKSRICVGNYIFTKTGASIRTEQG